MDQHMEDKEIGNTGVMQEQLDGIKYFFFLLMKEPEFTMKMMSTYEDVRTPPNQEKLADFT